MRRQFDVVVERDREAGVVEFSRMLRIRVVA